MIFWNINELKRRINNNELTEFNYFIYFIISCTSLLFIAISDRQSVTNILYLILNGVALPITCYLIHQFFQNKHFAEKYFALSLVRLLAYIIVLPILVLIFLYSIAFLMKFLVHDLLAALHESIEVE